jgi:DNA mismatch endonuclease (patch repair protein)
MSAIRGAGTRPELILRSALFARGLRFRVNSPGLSGRPDIKLTRHGAVILVHGCFWHGHHCQRFRMPSSNREFWAAKIARNRERDLEDLLKLREAGWRVCVVWECALRGEAFRKGGKRLVDALEKWVRGTRPFLELFDPAAVAPEAPCIGRRRSLGKNSDQGLFSAERRMAYAVAAAPPNAPPPDNGGRPGGAPLKAPRRGGRGR